MVIAARALPALADGPPSVADAGELTRAAARAAGEGFPAEAATLYRRAHELAPDDLAPLSGLAELALRAGDAEAAATLYGAALSIDATDRAARRGLGLALVELGRGEEALAVFGALLAGDPTDAASWNGRGLAHELLGQQAAAVDAFRSGLSFAPDDRELRANLELAAAQQAVAPGGPTAGSVEVALITERTVTRPADRPVVRD